MRISLSSPSKLRSKFRVAICGAGIAGLVLAITIGKFDPSIPIDLYEAHDSIDTVGAGIILPKQSHEVLIELGLLDDFKGIFTYSDNGSSVRRSDIPEGGYTWYRQVRRYTPPTMHRKHMVAILEKRLPASCALHLRKRLVNYVEVETEDAHSTSPLKLQFEDGTSAATDVLVGADGIRSAVRRALFEAAPEDKTDLKQYIEATFTGITLYRCLIPAGTLKNEDPENMSLKEMVTYVGKGRHFITYPIAQGAFINVVIIISDPSLAGTQYEGHWTSDATDDEVAEFFDDFEPDARTVVKLCGKPTKWALHIVNPLPFCVRKSVALIGDACHGMTPHLGAGAVHAVEDAFVLGRLLGHALTTFSRIPDALRIYEGVCFPLARDVANLSLSTGWMQPFMAPGYYDGTRNGDDLDDRGVSTHEREGMESLKQEILRRWDWIEEVRGPWQAWKEAELKLQAASASQVVN